MGLVLVAASNQEAPFARVQRWSQCSHLEVDSDPSSRGFASIESVALSGPVQVEVCPVAVAAATTAGSF